MEGVVSAGSPLVSVVIPLYNHESYVQETVRSVINQTYKNIELVVVDDGSTDSSWQKVNELKEESERRFVRTVFQTKKNEGTCETLNRLLDLAKGDFIYVIASDDIAKPQAIQKELDFLINNQDYVLVVGDNEIIDSAGTVCYWDRNRNLVYDRETAKYKTFGDFLERTLHVPFKSEVFGKYSALRYNNHVPNGYLIRVSIFKKIGKFTKEAPLEDYWLMLQLSKYGRMKYLDEILFQYRWHENNSIKKLDKMKIYTESTRKHEQRILENLQTKEILFNVMDYKTYGSLYKVRGIPHIFQIFCYRSKYTKTKLFKLFNYVVFKYERRCK